jgi:hypothetical protein
MKTISLKISKSLEQRLQQSAAEAGVNKSELLRQALERYLSQSKLPSKSSVVALAGDLVGCFRGPTDLSTNEDYFDEFGQ